MNAKNLVIDHKTNNDKSPVKINKKIKSTKKVKKTIYDESLKEIYNKSLMVIVNIINDLTLFDYKNFDYQKFKSIFINNNRYIYIVFVIIILLQLFLFIKFL